MQEGVGAADEPLRILHLRRHAGDVLHAPDTGDSGADTAAEQPAVALEDQAAQPPRGRVLRLIIRNLAPKRAKVSISFAFHVRAH